MTATDKPVPKADLMVADHAKRLTTLENRLEQMAKDVTNCMSMTSDHHDKSEALHRHMDRVTDDVRKQLAKEVQNIINHALSTMRLEAAEQAKIVEERE